MKIIEMKLQAEPFRQIAEGTKTVEIRLNDEKRKTVKVGDVIRFTCLSDTEKKQETRVKALYDFPNFSALFASNLFDKCGCGDMSKTEAAECMYKYYTKEEEKLYGVLAIELSLIK